jgi:hypothetical protein
MPRPGSRGVACDGRLAHDQPVLKGPAGGLAPGIHGELDGAELHLQDRVETVGPPRRGRQSGNEARLDLREDALEQHGRDVVALVDDNVTIPCDQVVDRSLADEALDHGDVQPSRRGTLARADLPDRLGVDAEKHGQLRDPLIQERLPMDQDQRRPGAGRDEVGPDDGLADARRRHENPDVVYQQRSGGLVLDGSQCALET